MADDRELLERGYQSREIKNIISEDLIARQDKILRRTIGLYKSHKLTNENLWAAIGEIVGLNDYLSDLNQDIKRGEQAQAREIGNG